MVLTSTLVANTTTYLDSRLSQTTQQFYRVRCDTGGVQSGYSNVTQATTAATVGDGIPGWWRYRYFGDGTTVVPGSEPNADADGDGISNYNEYLAGTDPTNASSAFRVQLEHSGSDAVLSFSTVAGKNYQIEVTDSLITPAVWTILAPNIVGTGNTVQYTDTTAGAHPRRFYRVSTVSTPAQ